MDASGGSIGGLRLQSARSLLFTVLGEYLRSSQVELWTAGAVEALRRLGVEEQAARQALTRTARDGWIEPERHGRRTSWRLTARAVDHFRESAELVYQDRRRATDWNGDWVMLMTSVPETRREMRHRLRTRLRWNGFGALGQGVWISPRPGAEKLAQQVMGELGLVAGAISVVGRIGGIGSEYEVVRRAWDLDELARDYSAFAMEFASGSRGADGDGGIVFTDLTRMVHRWREFVLRDPALPDELLPARWPGNAARDLFHRRHDAEYPTAAQWFRGLNAS